MSDNPHLYILEHHKFQLLKVLNEGEFHLVALVKNLEGINLELQLYIRSDHTSAMLDRFDVKVKRQYKFKERFTLPIAAYACHDKYTILCYRQVDSYALIPGFGFHDQEYASDDFEAIFNALELIESDLEKEPSLTPLIPGLRLIKTKNDYSVRLRIPGASPVHQSIITQNKADLLDLCPSDKLTPTEQFFLFRNRLLLYFICGKAKPIEFRSLYSLSPAMKKLFQAIKKNPKNCQLSLHEIYADLIRIEKRRKLIKIGISTFLLLFILAFIFKDSFFQSTWLGDIYDPPLEEKIILKTKENSPKKFSETALSNEQQVIQNLVELGYAQKATLRQQLSRPFYKNDANFQSFSFEIENLISQNFSHSLQEAKRAMETQAFDRAEQILASIKINYPKHPKQRELDNLAVSIPFKRAQSQQQQVKKKILVEQDIPSLEAVKSAYKKRLIKPLENLKSIYDLAKSYEDEIENNDLRHLLRCERLYAKAEYQLFYDAIKEKNLQGATAFLARHFPQYKTVKKITPYGFDLDDGSQASFTFFNEEQIADLFMTNISNSERKNINMALYCYKHKLNELFQAFSAQVKDPKNQKLLEFILRSVKVRESLKQQNIVES
ncbi:hypothetical protein PQO03_12905 [Lentisphaera profundi]|uniref:Uncharacterized protein n=1 Tax=Lentisphaera profundi TaxID=1658616 RepID=A0ABY7VWX2_9BACT|nr:hypothetical protein [Lentisphaera profundi]WDE98735.1 hypothetical protein PQO03_12905 [Lentisphaera profundi]